MFALYFGLIIKNNKMTQKELHDCENELFDEFAQFLKEKKHKNIVAMTLAEIRAENSKENPFNNGGGFCGLPLFREETEVKCRTITIMKTHIDFYENKINKLEEFWQKNLFDLIIDIIKKGEFSYFKPLKLMFSPIVLDPYHENEVYYAHREVFLMYEKNE